MINRKTELAHRIWQLLYSTEPATVQVIVKNIGLKSIHDVTLMLKTLTNNDLLQLVESSNAYANGRMKKRKKHFSGRTLESMQGKPLATSLMITMIGLSV